MRLRSSVPGIEKILAEVTAIHERAGFFNDDAGRKPAPQVGSDSYYK
jgi:hypothetical protein